ncbi:hypothetical protein ACHAXR_009367 [Thalassiosira sp. AJA248-18]
MAAIAPTQRMTPLICMMCLLISIALPGGSPNFVHASSSSIRKLSPPSSQQTSEVDDALIEIVALTNTTNTTNATTQSPTPTSTPMPTPTPQPTKKYEPSPDDEDEKKKEETKVGMIFLWIIVSFTLIWLVCYFRDAISFFFGSAWNNTRRYGCKGCLHSFFPFVFGSLSGGGGSSEPLDQIIFETEDPNAPLMS